MLVAIEMQRDGRTVKLTYRESHTETKTVRTATGEEIEVGPVSYTATRWEIITIRDDAHLEQLRRALWT